jgi:hypothetical protein
VTASPPVDLAAFCQWLRKAAMAFRGVPVFEVREVLRLWLRGEGIRPVERLSGVNRKTVRRYVDAVAALGLRQDGGEIQLSDDFLGSVVEAVRPHRSDGHGEAWRVLAGGRRRRCGSRTASRATS